MWSLIESLLTPNLVVPQSINLGPRGPQEREKEQPPQNLSITSPGTEEAHDPGPSWPPARGLGPVAWGGLSSNSLEACVTDY